MFDNIVEKLSIIFKAKETKDFATGSIENIAKFLLAKDIESGVREVADTFQYIGGIKDIFFWTKVKNWLENTYTSPEMEVRIATKFTEEEEKYAEYTKRQLQYIVQIDEEKKIDFYANLTRAWLMGFIHTSLYFKLSYLLRVFTLEELEYLKNNYTTDDITKVNFYIREFSLYGLVEVLITTDQGNSVYHYSQLADVLIRAGLSFDEERKMDFSNLKLEDLNVENTKSCMEIIEF